MHDKRTQTLYGFMDIFSRAKGTLAQIILAKQKSKQTMAR